MTWEPPKLSKGDVELLTIALDEYLYITNDELPVTPQLSNLLYRLEEHLKKF
jgi:hypothetical protein